MDLEWPNPKKFKRQEGLNLAYMAKYYEAEVAKKVIEFMNSGQAIVDDIKKKYTDEEDKPYVG